MLKWTQLDCWPENPELPYVAWRRYVEARGNRTITLYIYGPPQGRDPVLDKHRLLGYRGYSLRIEEGRHRGGKMIYARTIMQAMAIVNSDHRKGILL